MNLPYVPVGYWDLCGRVFPLHVFVEKIQELQKYIAEMKEFFGRKSAIVCVYGTNHENQRWLARSPCQLLTHCVRRRKANSHSKERGIRQDKNINS